MLSCINILLFIITKIQSDLSFVNFQLNSEIWSRKTGGCVIQVKLIDMKCTVKGNKN